MPRSCVMIGFPARILGSEGHIATIGLRGPVALWTAQKRQTTITQDRAQDSFRIQPEHTL